MKIQKCNLWLIFALGLSLWLHEGFAQEGSVKPLEVNEQGNVSLDFVDAEIAEVAKSISELMKKNFLLDDKVRGKITMISPNPISVQEAYHAFVSALEVKGFTIIQVGKIAKIVPLREMKQQAIPTGVTYASGGSDAFITRLVQLKYISASEIVKTLKGLVSKNGDITSYDPTNTLIITESIANLRRLITIIEKLDQKGHQESLEVIRLQYASAAETAEKLMTIFNISGGKGVKAPTPGAVASEASQRFISNIIPYERTNSIIVLANKEGLEQIRSVVSKLDEVVEEEVGKGRIHVHPLQYADASELAGTLASLTGGSAPVRQRSSQSGRTTTRGNQADISRVGMPPSRNTQPSRAEGGSGSKGLSLFGGDIMITADIPTNALVITAEPADYESLLPVIRKLDVRRPQAYVEAMIIEVDIDKAFELGVAGNVGDQFGSNNENLIFGGTQFGNVSSLSLPLTATGLTAGFQGRTIDLNIGGSSVSIPIYGAIFRALQSNGIVNILSTPSIVTQDNMEAEIVVGEVVPFVTAQGRDVNNQPINQIVRENVALTLRVTPQINESQDVTMDIFQEVQDLVAGPNAEQFGPTTSTRSTRTTVLVKDGQTVTIGGLINDRITETESKVPILGDIPLLGWLFQSKSKRKRKASLSIFITPHILRTPEDMERISIQKNEERQKFLKENQLSDHPGIQKYNLDRELKLPPPAIQSSPPKSSHSDSPTDAFLPPSAKQKSDPIPISPQAVKRVTPREQKPAMDTESTPLGADPSPNESDSTPDADLNAPTEPKENLPSSNEGAVVGE